MKVKTPPSTSESFDATVPLAGVFSGVVTASFEATGLSFTAFTVIVNVAVSHKPLGSHTA